MAILWEQRAHLRRAYDLTRPASCNNYIVWCLTNGIEDGLVVPELVDAMFWEELGASVGSRSGYEDMPINRMLAMLHAARDASDWVMQAADEPQTWLELALWTMFVASRKYRWPASMMRSLREYAAAPVSSFTVDGIALPRLLLMMWESRADLRVNVDPSREDGRAALLYWFLFYGMKEYGISRDELPDYFLRHLLDTPESGELPLAHRLLHSGRPDLIARFDTRTKTGQAGYLAWFHELGIVEIGCGHLFASLPSVSLQRVSQVQGDRASTSPPRIVLTGRLHEPSGRGEDIRMSMRALAALGVPFVTLDRDDGLIRDAKGQVVSPDIAASAQINILHLNADSAFIDYQFLRRYGIGDALLIGYWAWELAKLPFELVSAFSFVDEVWASTAFAFSAFDIGYRPVKLLPMPVELPADLLAVDRSYFRLPMFRFIFLFSFDFKSYMARKNPAAVIAAFRQAFPQSAERVTLVIKTINAESFPSEWQRLQSLIGHDGRIILRNCQYTRAEMCRLVSLCDCYVSLHRSEGFGRGPAEAMALGKPVIATNYSGNVDFMNADNSFPVDYTLVSVGEDEYPGACGQVWAEPDITHAAAHMRRVYDDRDYAERIGPQAGRFMKSRYSAERLGRRYLKRLSELESQLSTTAGRTTISSVTETAG
jgi:glycosyltransferase involved in cell wall biosynthesis